MIQSDYWQSQEDKTAPKFNSKEDLLRIKSEAVVFHRCKDASITNFLRVHGAEGEPSTGCGVPLETHAQKTESKPEEELTISDKIRIHVAALLSIAEGLPGRKAMILIELRKAKLAPKSNGLK